MGAICDRPLRAHPDPSARALGRRRDHGPRTCRNAIAIVGPLQRHDQAGQTTSRGRPPDMGTCSATWTAPASVGPIVNAVVGDPASEPVSRRKRGPRERLQNAETAYVDRSAAGAGPGHYGCPGPAHTRLTRPVVIRSRIASSGSGIGLPSPYRRLKCALKECRVPAASAGPGQSC